MPGDREKSIARGANDYVPKPVDVDQLLTVVCALLDPERAPDAEPEDHAERGHAGSESAEPEGPAGAEGASAHEAAD